MFIEKEVFDKLCPSYQKILEKFESEYFIMSLDEDEESLMKRDKLLWEFSQNYFMLSNFWEEYFRVFGNLRIRSLKLERTRARKHFCPKDLYYRNCHGFKKLLHEREYSHDPFMEYNPLKNELLLPRKNLDQFLRLYEEYIKNPLPKEAFLNYQNSKILYKNIMAAENDVEKWFNLISQVKDIEYVSSNVEYRIGNEFYDQKLWKLYINYLKQNDTKRLLYLYSCYCRFFIDDSEMKEEYKKAAEIYGPSFVSWKNLFDFETFEEEKIDREVFVNDPVTLALYIDTKEYIVPEPNLRNDQKISLLNFYPQEFSFPKTIIFYIIKKNENSSILRNLHHSCKYFFAVMSYPVCHNLELRKMFHENCIKSNYTEFNGNSASICYNPPTESEFVFGRQFIISNKFDFQCSKSITLSSFLPNIFQCNAKFLKISSQNITFKEFVFLVGHKNVEKLLLSECKIINDKNTDVELFEILTLTPKIIEFENTEPKITEQTFAILTQMNFKNKFEYFRLCSLTYIEPYGFLEFLKKNLDSECIFHAYYDDDRLASPELKAGLKMVKNELQKLWPQNDYIFMP